MYMVPEKVSRKLESTSFHSLPDSFWLKIIQNIENAKHLSQLQLVDHRFKRLVSQTPKLSIKADDFRHSFRSIFELIATKLIMNCSRLVTLHVEFPEESTSIQEITWLAWCIHFGETIEEITLVNSTNNETRQPRSSGEWKFEHVLKHCLQLKRICLHNVVFTRNNFPFFRKHEKLRHVKLQNAKVSHAAVKKIVSHCPSLEELSFISCSGLGPLDLFDVLCPTLRKFELVTEFVPSLPHLELLRLNAPNLETLTLVLDGIPGKLSEDIPPLELEIRSERLTELHLDLDGPLDFKFSQEVLGNLKSLRIMGDDWAWETVDFLLKGSSLSLRHLHLHASVPSLVDLDAGNFFDSMLKLEVLSVSHEFFFLLSKGVSRDQKFSKKVISQLRILQFQSLTCGVEELRFIEKLLESAPNLQNVAHEFAPLRLNSEEADFHIALKRLRLKHPGKIIL